MNRTRHFENIYGDTGSPNYEPIDTNASVDILQYLIVADSLANGAHYARIRHRDGNALWSDWSSSLTFEITEGIVFSVGTDISTVTMSSSTVSAGDDFTVHFSDGPGTPKDWMGIFKKGETPGPDMLTAYLYVDGNTDGSVTFQLPDLEAGDYFLALFTNDSYTEVSPRLNFTVEPFEILSTASGGNTITVKWKTTSGREYVIQKSLTMAAESWTDVNTVTGNGSEMEETVAGGVGESRFFVRIKKEPT